MADITEIIHRITYEVNDAALQNAAKAIHTQIIELNTLSKILQGYRQQLDATSAGETKKIEQLNKKIDTTTKLLEISTGKAKGTLSEMGGVLNTTGLENHRNEIQRTINSYTSLATTASQAFQTIYNAQIKVLDMEIAIREKRVGEAVKLAERGNVEVLRLEEERLKETQKKREQYARREQVVNAAVTISNAIVAIAKAAAEGAGQGGYGAIATVAATIAALAAGYAAVQSLSTNTNDAFKDGVVGYRGNGGPRDDVNRIRISNGESVITAEGTKANRHILEAINKGAQLHIINPALSYTIPAFSNPKQSEAYASQYDLRNLEAKLDNVVHAIEDNRLKQDIFFNEQGVGMMTERAIKRNNRRFR